MTGYKN